MNNAKSISAAHSSSLISAVIIHVGSAQIIQQCVESLRQAVDSTRLETIIVDNASETPSLAEIADTYPNTRIVRLSDRCGYSAATNAGIRASQGTYILWCNNDLVFKPGSVDILATFLDTHPRYGAVGPRLSNADGSYQPSFSLLDISLWTLLPEVFGLGRFFPFLDMRQHSRGKVSVSRDVISIPGACALIRRTALESIGGALDERFFLYSEEFDLSRSLRSSGWRLKYLPQSEVIHLGGQSTTMTQQKYLMLTQAWRSHFAYLRKHHGLRSESTLACMLFLGLVLRFGLTWLRHNAAYPPRLRHSTAESVERLTWYRSMLRLCLSPDRHEASLSPHARLVGES